MQRHVAPISYGSLYIIAGLVCKSTSEFKEKMQQCPFSTSPSRSGQQRACAAMQLCRQCWPTNWARVLPLYPNNTDTVLSNLFPISKHQRYVLEEKVQDDGSGETYWGSTRLRRGGGGGRRSFVPRLVVLPGECEEPGYEVW